MLFDKQFVFYGTNAEHVIALVDKQHVFDRVFDVYLLGAVVGFLNKRRDTVKKRFASYQDDFCRYSC